MGYSFPTIYPKVVRILGVEMLLGGNRMVDPVFAFILLISVPLMLSDIIVQCLLILGFLFHLVVLLLVVVVRHVSKCFHVLSFFLLLV